MAKPSAKKLSSPAPQPGRVSEGAWTWWHLAGALAIAAAAWWSFGPSLHGSWFVDWDDDYNVTENGNLRTLAGLWNIWFPSSGAEWRDWPLTSTFLWIEWHLFGDQTTGYHVCSLALHVLSGLLIWRLLGRLGLRWGWLGGLLFVVHPLAVESVAWISEIKNTLSLPLFLLSFDAFLDFDRDGKKITCVRSLAYFLAAMLAKTSVVMLPFVLLLYCWWKRGRLTLADLKRSAPFFLVALVWGLITLHLQSQTAAADVIAPRSPAEVVLCAGYEIFFYAGNFLVPTGLCLIYPRWTFSPATTLQLSTWPFLVILFGLLWAQRKTWGRHALFGLGFFVLNLLPMLGFLKMVYMRVTWAADHFVYLPMVGLIGLTVAGMEWGSRLFPAKARYVMPGLAAALVIWWSFVSHDYSAVFVDEKTLWTATMQRNPEALAPHNNLGMILMNAGETQSAIDQYRLALQVDPLSPEAHTNLGYALQVSGDANGAVAEFREAVRIKPGIARTHFNLGVVLLAQGRLPEAIDELAQSVKLQPDNIDAVNKLVYALDTTGRAEEAIPYLEISAQAHPEVAVPHYNLGLALIKLNRFEEAAKEFATAQQINPNLPGVADLLARAQAGALQQPKGP